jgi:hypothetical protein
VYLVLGNHDISLFLYITFKDYIRFNRKQIVSSTRKSTYENIYEDIDLFGIHVTPKYLRYEDYFGFNQDFKNKFINYIENSDKVKLFYFNQGENGNKLIASHTIISDVETPYLNVKVGDSISLINRLNGAMIDMTINFDLNSNLNLNNIKCSIDKSGSIKPIINIINKIKNLEFERKSICIKKLIKILYPLFTNSLYDNSKIMYRNTLNYMSDNVKSYKPKTEKIKIEKPIKIKEIETKMEKYELHMDVKPFKPRNKTSPIPQKAEIKPLSEKSLEIPQKAEIKPLLQISKNIPYYIGHYNILEAIKIQSSSVDILTQIFETLCKLSSNFILFEHYRDSENAKCIVQNYIENNNIIYCDIGASPFVNNNFKLYMKYEFISYRYISNNQVRIYYNKPIDVSAIFNGIYEYRIIDKCILNPINNRINYNKYCEELKHNLSKMSDKVQTKYIMKTEGELDKDFKIIINGNKYNMKYFNIIDLEM